MGLFVQGAEFCAGRAGWDARAEDHDVEILLREGEGVGLSEVFEFFGSVESVFAIYSLAFHRVGES